MAGTAGLDWIWYAAGAVFGIAGLALLVWALFWDRSRGRSRCPKCWYDMQGAETDEAGTCHCPECGRTITRERKLHRTRRRWRWAAVALVAFVGAAYLVVQPTVRRDGWWSLVSNRMLLAILPLTPTSDDFIDEELVTRLSGMTLREDELKNFYRRCADGDWRARPISDRWQRKYGRLLERTQFNMRNFALVGGAGASKPLPDSALAELPMLFELRTRERWPEGIPVYIEARMKDWWPSSDHPQVLIDPPGAGDDEIMMFGQLYGFEAPWVTSEQMEAALDYRVLRVSRRASERTKVEVDRGTKTVPINIRGRIEDIIFPVRDPELDAMLAETMVYSATSRDGRIIAVSHNFWDTRNALPPGVAVGGYLEFSHEGAFVARKPVWWSVVENTEGNLEIKGNNLSQFSGNYARLNAASSTEGWTLRFRSDPEIALRAIDADRYWEGDVEIAFEIRIR